MFEPKYLFYLNDTYFDSIYPVDYYNDKKVFFTSGAKQFFIMYQILRHMESVLTIKEGTSSKIVSINNEDEFIQWVKRNYPMFVNKLTKF